MAFFPMFYDVEGKECIFVGGGAVATRKINVILEFGVKVKVIAPRISNELKELEKQGRIEVVLREYRKGDIDGAFMVVPTTENSELNHEIYEEAIKKGIHVNSSDGLRENAFVFPAIIKRGDVVAAVTSSGGFPMLTAHLRDVIDKAIDPDVDEALRILRNFRARLKNLDVVQKRKDSFMKLAFNIIIEGISESNPVLNNRTLLEKRLERLYNDFFEK